MKKHPNLIPSRIILLVAFFSILINRNIAQEKKMGDVEAEILKVTILNPGISYERRIGKFQTILMQGYGGLSVYSETSLNAQGTKTTKVHFNLDPSLTLQYRYYYNFSKRQLKGKQTEMNNLNYIAPIGDISLSKRPIGSNYIDKNIRRPVYTVGGVWGIQRNYVNRFSLDFNLGLGYLFTKSLLLNSTGYFEYKDVSQFTFLGQLSLGIWLNKRKKPEQPKY